ncbi:MAG: NAD(P)H-dependent glycerol-3-phosphate dehydrogenase [Bacilli bacterium]|jgi:glycerol-3-phosphate dehydrogenase [NAD(P)+]|nr:NAD(P)-dependent glycerol-3-phosphate dehydrogenase [Staphylococcus sp.]
MEKVSIIGAGSWGSALARILGDNHYQVLLYDTDKNTVDEINHFHTNLSKLPVGMLPLKVKATTSIKEVIDFSDIIVLSVPTKVLRSVLNLINEIIDKPKLFVNTSKGLEPDTYLRVSEVLNTTINNHYIKGFVALTGPSHAEEVIRQLPTTICSVSTNKEDAKLIQKIFNNSTYFRVYTGSDLVGSELCSAIKNVYAIASGMLEGCGYGDNARAGLISRALVEMKRIVVAMGGKEDTIYGLTGVGDLVVTTTSHHSRNFQAGVKLAKGSNLAETIASMSMVVEGARTAEAVYEVSKKLNLSTPIIDAVYNVIYRKQSVKKAVAELMNRSLKDE